MTHLREGYSLLNILLWGLPDTFISEQQLILIASSDHFRSLRINFYVSIFVPRRLHITSEIFG